MKFQGATFKQVKNYDKGQVSAHLGLVLHVAVGNGSLYGWFNNPSAQASSNFWAGKLGEYEQYVDTDDKAWAQADGNSTYCSVETEGYPTEKLTMKQKFVLARIYAEGHQHYGWPFQEANSVGERGFAWHGMGGDAWGGHPLCPGDLRKNDRPQILKFAQGKRVWISKKDKQGRTELQKFKKEHGLKSPLPMVDAGVRYYAHLPRGRKPILHKK